MRVGPLKQGDLLCSRTGPITWSWNSELCIVLNGCGYQHCFVARQDSLTKRDIAFRIVLTPNVAGTVDTVWLIRKWLLNLAVVITVKSSILQTLVR